MKEQEEDIQHVDFNHVSDSCPGAGRGPLFYRRKTRGPAIWGGGSWRHNSLLPNAVLQPCSPALKTMPAGPKGSLLCEKVRFKSLQSAGGCNLLDVNSVEQGLGFSSDEMETLIGALGLMRTGWHREQMGSWASDGPWKPRRVLCFGFHFFSFRACSCVLPQNCAGLGTLGRACGQHPFSHCLVTGHPLCARPGVGRVGSGGRLPGLHDPNSVGPLSARGRSELS